MSFQFLNIYLLASAIWLLHEIFIKNIINGSNDFKTMKASYINWLFSNLMIYVYIKVQIQDYISQKQLFKRLIEAQKDFFPFSNQDTWAYDEFEIFFYCLIPLVAFFILYSFDYYKTKDVSDTNNYPIIVTKPNVLFKEKSQGHFTTIKEETINQDLNDYFNVALTKFKAELIKKIIAPNELVKLIKIDLNDRGIILENKQEVYLLKRIKETSGTKLEDEFYINMSQTLIKNGEFDNAIKVLRKLITIEPRNFDAWYNLGEAFNRKGKYDEAIKSYNRANLIKSNNFDAWYNSAMLYSQKINANKQTSKFRLHKICTFYNQKLVCDMAINGYRKALTNRPNEFTAWFSLGKVLNRKGEILLEISSCFRVNYSVNSTIYIFEHLTTLFIKPIYKYFINIKLNKFQIFKYQKYWQQAIISYNKALEINSNSYDVLIEKGESLYNMKLFKDAIDTYYMALKIKPNDYFSWCCIGKSFLKNGLYQDAISSYKKAVEIKPDNSKSWRLLGHAYFISGQSLKGELRKEIMNEMKMCMEVSRSIENKNKNKTL